jgi:hypothetical protein
MENVIKYVTGFFGGLLSIMMAVVPVAVFGEGGFVGLVALVILAKFFIDKK